MYPVSIILSLWQRISCIAASHRWNTQAGEKTEHYQTNNRGKIKESHDSVLFLHRHLEQRSNAVMRWNESVLIIRKLHFRAGVRDGSRTRHDPSGTFLCPQAHNRCHRSIVWEDWWCWGLCFYLQLHFSAIWTRVLASKTRWNRWKYERIDALIFLMINNLAKRRKATTRMSRQKKKKKKKKKNDRLSAGDIVCRHLLVFFRLQYIRFPFLLSSH